MSRQSPRISDREYDQLIDELKALESEHPELITADSPTQRVGDQPVSHLQSVAHRIPMLSIDNTYSIEELQAYYQRTVKRLPGEEIAWIVELKVDGVLRHQSSMSGGFWYAVVTRGGRSGRR